MHTFCCILPVSHSERRYRTERNIRQISSVFRSR
nr:MAG TPA: hypothetical protein [Caudoviricetes sp.]